MQVIRLEVRIHGEMVREWELDDSTAQLRENAMAVLACIVVACSARLEELDLHLDWMCVTPGLRICW